MIFNNIIISFFIIVMQLLLNPASIESFNNGSSKPKNKTLKKVNFTNNNSSTVKINQINKK